MKVLIVDDSTAIQSLIRRALNKSGIDPLEIECASDGESALAIAQHWEPELVLTDWNMPVMNGNELVRRLRQLPFGDKVKIGFISASTNDASINEAQALNADFYLIKPFPEAELIMWISMLATPSARVLSLRADSLIEQQYMALLGERVLVMPSIPDSNSLTSIPCALGTYVSAGGDSHVACVLDHAAMLIIGGTLLNMELPELTALYASREVPPAIWAASQRLFETDILSMLITKESSPPRLLRAQLLQTTLPQIRKISSEWANLGCYSFVRSELAGGTLSILAR